MQYVLLIGLVLLLVAGYAIVVAVTRANAGMHLWHQCRKRYEELSRQGIGSRESRILICKEQYPHLSDEVHNRIVDKCHDVWQLANFFSVVLENPRPKSWARSGPLDNQEAEALIESTVVDERSHITTDYKAATDRLVARGFK